MTPAPLICAWTLESHTSHWLQGHLSKIRISSFHPLNSNPPMVSITFIHSNNTFFHCKSTKATQQELRVKWYKHIVHNIYKYINLNYIYKSPKLRNCVSCLPLWSSWPLIPHMVLSCTWLLTHLCFKMKTVSLNSSFFLSPLIPSSIFPSSPNA